MPLSTLDSAPRLAKISAVAYGPSNPQLDRVVAAVAALAGTPIALVTLVAESIQYLRASVGLPGDLQASRATSRCDSFCQFVVASGSAFVVSDGQSDSRVPKRLVETYGIRAYAGVPLYIEQEVVGSLAAADTSPRDFDAGMLRTLSAYGGVVSTILESEWRDRVHSQARNPARVTMEAAALDRLGEAHERGEISQELAQRGRGALHELEGALADSVMALPQHLRTLIEDYLASVSADNRSFALARLALATDYPRLAASPATAGALGDKLEAAIAKLRA